MLAAQQPAPQRLTLNDAITLALKNNLSVRVAGTQVGEAEGARERQLATLLPHVTGDSLANLQNRNLAVLGVSVPGIPTVVGPFSYLRFPRRGQPNFGRPAVVSQLEGQPEPRASHQARLSRRARSGDSADSRALPGC